MSFTQYFGNTRLTDKNGGSHSVTEKLDGKVVGFYFSAHWCPPCRGYTPRLAQEYTAMKAAGRPFEIVFISSDSNQSSFDGYLGEMPWLALPFSERAKKSELSSKFGVRGIPTLILFNGDGTMLTPNGRSVCNAASFPFGGTFGGTSSSASESKASSDPQVAKLFKAADLGGDNTVSHSEIVAKMKQVGQSDSRCNKLAAILLESSSNGETLTFAEFCAFFDSLGGGEALSTTKQFVAKAFGVTL